MLQDLPPSLLSPRGLPAVQAIQSSVAGLPGVDLNNPDVQNAINEAAKDGSNNEGSKKDEPKK